MDNKVIIPNDIFFSEIEAMLKEEKKVRIRVVGRSMQPTFKHLCDEIVISSIDSMQLIPLNVVLFNKASSSKCVHRIIRRVGDTLYIRGDGNYGPFEVATIKDVIGVVVGGTMRNGVSFSIDDNKWKRWSSFWVAIYPLRKIYFSTRHFIGNIYRHIF